MAKPAKSKMKPPPVSDLEKARQEFIKEPEKRKTEDTETSNADKKSRRFPWEHPEVNERVIKAFNLRLPEPEFLKLKFVVDETKFKSIHAFCLNAVQKAVERELKKLT